jgi:hypothetical protein
MNDLYHMLAWGVQLKDSVSTGLGERDGKGVLMSSITARVEGVVWVERRAVTGGSSWFITWIIDMRGRQPGCHDAT